MRYARHPSAARSLETPPGFRTTKELISENGYGYELHRIETEDGFLLKTHRILTKTPNGPPILLQHGFLATSETMMLMDKNSLAMQLADAGFDVWLNDQRGNWYSREHVKYKPNHYKFWDFSFHESGYYDLPAVIDRIIYVTNYSQIFYLGHSLGTTVYLVMASLRPEYNQKIKTAVLLSPVATVPSFKEMTSPILRIVLVNADGIYKLTNRGGLYELMPRVTNFLAAVKKVCGPSNVQDYCLDFVGLTVGEHRTNLNTTRLGDQACYLGAGSSIKTAHHLSQIYKKGFRQYDYGPEENMRRYNNVTPPSYPLHKATAPIALFWGDNDIIINNRSIYDLANMLPNVIENYMVEDPKFNHIDFMIGLNSPIMSNNHIINLLKSVR
ncbi:lipase 1-like isoform X2 [Rhodnius prolixus]